MYSLSGSFSRTFTKGLLAPCGLAFADGIQCEDLFVCDSESHSILVLDPSNGTCHRKWGRKGSGTGELNRPRDVQVSLTNGTGELFVSDNGNNRICVFTLHGTHLRNLYSVPCPTGIAFTGCGSLFVCCTTANSLRLVRCQDGGLISQQAFSWPKGVAVAQDGTVFLCSQSLTLQAYK